MLIHTRRRALGLLIAASIGARLLPARARAAEEEAETGDEAETEQEADGPECYDSKDFGPWKAQASNSKAGAGLSDVPVLNPNACDLTMQFQINTSFESKIFVTGSPEGTPLPEEFLVKPENRLIAKIFDAKTADAKTANSKTSDGKIVVDEQLCGNCTDIYDDSVSIVLPLATAPLFREEETVELALRLAGKTADCRFKIDCVTMRQALDWASERRDALAEESTQDECAPPEGCFITTACCEIVGLDDDCFELRSLRRYRDEVLAKQPGGAAAIARYYAQAPHIVAQISAQSLISVYACFVLPAALAARLGLNALAYRLYVRMLDELSAETVPDTPTGAKNVPRPLL